ncbi:MAG: hypothetical protein C4292_06340 [Nitrososphaera sp.]
MSYTIFRATSFGYKPESTILQVHMAGFFGRKGSAGGGKKAEQRKEATKRYWGTTFVVVGRTHDPAVMDRVIRPRTKEGSPCYVGYLWMGKDPGKRPPHELVPLDFTPVHLHYPRDWKDAFVTKGMLVAMHVPSSFAKGKGELTRALHRIGKEADVKQEWRFLEELKKYGCYAKQQQQDKEERQAQTTFNAAAAE